MQNSKHFIPLQSCLLTLLSCKLTDLLEAMSKAEPLFLHQYLKASYGSVVRVQHYQGQRGQLSSSVPAVTAMNHHGGFP